jgi:hypothetical protein
MSERDAPTDGADDTPADNLSGNGSPDGEADRPNLSLRHSRNRVGGRDQRPPDAGKNRGVLAWFLVAGVCVGVGFRIVAACRSYTGAESIAQDLAQVVGTGLAMVFWVLVVNRIKKDVAYRTRAASVTWPILAVCFSVWCLYTSARMITAANELRQHAVEATNQLEDLLEFTESPHALPPSQEVLPSPIPDDDVAVSKMLMDTMMRRLKPSILAFANALRELDVESIFGRTIFGSTDEIASGITRVAAFQVVLSEVEGDYRSNGEDARSAFDKIRSTGVRSKGINALRISLDHNELVFTAWRQYANEIRKLLEFLIAKNGQYEVSDGQLLFAIADLESFNEMLSRIDTLANRISVADAAQKARMRSAIVKLESVTGK